MIGDWHPVNFAFDALLSALGTRRPSFHFRPLARTRVLLALIADPFRIFHQLFFRLLSSGQFPRILTLIEYAPSSWIALPLWTPLLMLAMTVKHQVSSEYRK